MPRTLLERAVRLRTDDLTRALPLAAAYGLVMAALYVLKPTRNALFLQHFSANELPYVMLLVASAGAITSLGYARYARVVRLDVLLHGLFFVFILSLLLFRLLFRSGEGSVVYLFYVWVALYGVLSSSLLWQLANAEFNAREARRVFGFIGTGGIAGAIVGGLCAGFLAKLIGTDNLLLLAAFALCGSLLCLRAAPQSRPRGQAELATSQGALGDVRNSRLLRLIAVSGALVAVVAVIADVQFNAVVERAFAEKDDKTVFFGVFFASINAAAIVVQLFVTPRVLTSLGVGAGLLVLPLGLGVGTLSLLFFPSLLTGVLPKVADASLRHSVHRAASEVLFIPLPALVTRRVKLFIDATVDTLFTGLGALLVLLLIERFGVSHRALSVATLVLLVVWLGVTLRLRAAYVDAFRAALSRRELDVSELRINISDAPTVDALVKALDGGSPRQLRYALEMLMPVRDERLSVRVPQLLRHADAEVRAHALRVLSGQRWGDSQLGEQLLDDPDHRVRVEAAHYLCQHGERGQLHELQRLLSDERPERQAAALGVIARYGGRRERALLDREQLEHLLTADGPERALVRAHIAQVLADSAEPALASFWRALMNDPHEGVVRQTIESAGRSLDAAHVPWLLSLLDDKRYRMDARLALAHYGGAVLEPIDVLLSDRGTSERVRRTLPRVLARIGSQRSVDIVLTHLQDADGVFKDALIGALEKLRRRFPSLRFDDPRVQGLLDQEVEAYDRNRTAEADLADLELGPAGRLLLQALSEKRQERLHRIFQLLSLRYASEDMAGAYRGLNDDKSARHASALEFLDNLLPRELAARLLPALERRSRPSVTPPPPDAGEALRALLHSEHGWLRVCALYALQKYDLAAARACAREIRDDDDPLVRETASMVLGTEGGLPGDRAVG